MLEVLCAGADSSSFLCMAGLHGAVLELFSLHGDDHNGRQWSFQQLCSMHAPPSHFCHSWDSGSDTEDVPGSLLLLAGSCSAQPAQVLRVPLLAQETWTSRNNLLAWQVSAPKA